MMYFYVLNICPAFPFGAGRFLVCVHDASSWHLNKASFDLQGSGEVRRLFHDRMLIQFACLIPQQ